MDMNNQLHLIRYAEEGDLPDNKNLKQLIKVADEAGRGWEHRIWRPEGGKGWVTAIHFTILRAPLIDRGHGVVIDDLCLVYGLEERHRATRSFNMGKYYPNLGRYSHPTRHIIQSRTWEGGNDAARLAAPGEYGQYCTGGNGSAYNDYRRRELWAKAWLPIVGSATSWQNYKSLIKMVCVSCGESIKEEAINKCGVCHHSRVYAVCDRCLERHPELYTCRECGIVTCGRTHCFSRQRGAGYNGGLCSFCLKERSCYYCARSDAIRSLDTIVEEVDDITHRGWRGTCEHHAYYCGDCGCTIIPGANAVDALNCPGEHYYQNGRLNKTELCWECGRKRQITHLLESHDLTEEQADDALYTEPPYWASFISREEQDKLVEETGRVTRHISPLRIKRITLATRKKREREQREYEERLRRLNRESREAIERDVLRERPLDDDADEDARTPEENLIQGWSASVSDRTTSWTTADSSAAAPVFSHLPEDAYEKAYTEEEE